MPHFPGWFVAICILLPIHCSINVDTFVRMIQINSILHIYLPCVVVNQSLYILFFTFHTCVI